MTDPTLIPRLAREAGIANIFLTPQFSDVFASFAELVAEECARIAERSDTRHGAAVSIRSRFRAKVTGDGASWKEEG